METGQKSINEVEAMYTSLTSTVDESKRKQKVCIHWMKNQCKKGQRCEYLHTYVEEKVPICRYIQSDGYCQKEDQCIYRHPKPDEGPAGMGKKQEHCPYFQRGFCKLSIEYCPFYHGDNTEICFNYFLGFCPDGPNCNFEHVKSTLSPQDLSLASLAYFPKEENWIDSKMHQQHNSGMNQGGGGYGNRNQGGKIICHRCGKEGHKSTYCQEDKITEEEMNARLIQDPSSQIQNMHVNCFYCKKKGHYANHCPSKQLKNVSAQQPVVNREQRLYDQINSLQPTAPTNFNGVQDQSQKQNAMDVQEHSPLVDTSNNAPDVQMNDVMAIPIQNQQSQITPAAVPDSFMNLVNNGITETQNSTGGNMNGGVPVISTQQQQQQQHNPANVANHHQQDLQSHLTSDKEINNPLNNANQQPNSTSSFVPPLVDDQFVPITCLSKQYTIQDLPLTPEEVKNAVLLAAQEINPELLQGISPPQPINNFTNGMKDEQINI